MGIFVLLMLNIGCDQISKSIVRQRIDYNERIELLDSYLTLTKVENSGAFLSFGDSLPAVLKIILLSALPVLALGFGLVFLFSNKNIPLLSLLGICFAIGGGIGNIYDRIMYGSVTDFLHMDFGIFQTGIFNMADVSIMIGLALILIQSYLDRNEQSTLEVK